MQSVEEGSPLSAIKKATTGENMLEYTHTNNPAEHLHFWTGFERKRRIPECRLAGVDL